VITALIARRVDLALGAVHGPDGLAADIPAACAAYEEATTAVDLQIWAPGLTGTWASTGQAHLASRTRIKTLTE
jgi:glucosamine-6-phosphate deaminase